MNGQAYGTKQIHVALLDANGSLYNPPVTKSISVNYQSSGGGYQTPVGDYIAVGFPSSGSLILPSNDTLQVYTNYNRTGSLNDEMITYVRYNDAKHQDFASNTAMYIYQRVCGL